MAKTFKEYLEDFNQQSLFGFDSTTGQVIPQTSNVLSAVRNLLNDIFDRKLNMDDSSPAGILTTAWALQYARFCAVTALYANQVNPNYATGQMLDAIGSLFSITRNAATSLVINITCTGRSGTTIPAGSLIGDKAGNVFSVIGNISLTGTGTGTGTAVCTEKGLKEVEIGAVSNIITTLVGWETVSNTGVAVAASDIESDASFRNRVATARWTGTAFIEAINAEIQRVSGVTSSMVIENVESKTMYLFPDRTFSATIPESGKYIVFPPHSILVIVTGSANNNDVGYAILKTKSVGCSYTYLNAENQNGTARGNVVTVRRSANNDMSGILYTIVFNTPLSVSFGVNLKVSKNKYSGTDDELKTQIKDAIKSWAIGEVPSVDGIDIGQSIYSYEIGAAVSDVIPPIKILNVELTNGNTTSSSLDIFISEIATLDENKISITIVP